jgi:transcriptional regulator with XRE-family HTH domain
MIELKIFLLRNGLDQPLIAAELGITKQYVSDIFAGKRKALHIRRRMVDELGIPAELVAWREPDRRAA